MSCLWIHHHSKMSTKKYNISGRGHQYNQTNTENHREKIGRFWKIHMAFHFPVVLPTAILPLPLAIGRSHLPDSDLGQASKGLSLFRGSEWKHLSSRDICEGSCGCISSFVLGSSPVGKKNNPVSHLNSRFLELWVFVSPKKNKSLCPNSPETTPLKILPGLQEVKRRDP